jgi:hypothetical protein
VAEQSDRIEEEFGDYILALDDDVLETFYAGTAQSDRRHVKHLAVEFKENRKGDTIHANIGALIDGSIMEGSRVDIPIADKDRAEAFFNEVRKRKDAAKQRFPG